MIRKLGVSRHYKSDDNGDSLHSDIRTYCHRIPTACRINTPKPWVNSTGKLGINLPGLSWEWKDFLSEVSKPSYSTDHENVSIN